MNLRETTTILGDIVFVLSEGRKKQMTPEQAYREIRKTRSISTAMLKPLGISMENFLKYSQLPDVARKKFLDNYLKYLEKE